MFACILLTKILAVWCILSRQDVLAEHESWRAVFCYILTMDWMYICTITHLYMTIKRLVKQRHVFDLCISSSVSFQSVNNEPISFVESKRIYHIASEI